jgi:putative transposase
VTDFSGRMGDRFRDDSSSTRSLGMPWKEVNPMELRKQFIADWRRGKRTVMELCAMYGISRKTAYKWIERYEAAAGGQEAAGGWAADRSHAAHVVHNKTSQEIEEALMLLRLRFPRWGARKLVHEVGLMNPQWQMPAESTVCDMLKRRGLIESKPRRRAVGHPGRPSQQITGPNDCWSADYKGQFRLGNGEYCFPLTVTDNYSRYLLACHGLEGTLLEPTKAVFTRVFKEYGLPSRIRTDNGVPFAAVTLGRLSQLAVWWIKLGILPELIVPGRPQQNGRHERMHRTLKDEATKPPASSAQGQQRKLNVFRHEYNELRPHENLDMSKPVQLYVPSPREMPSRLLPMEYPDRYEVRKVSSAGGIRWGKQYVNVTSALVGEYVGLEAVEDGQWDVYFGVKRLGRLHERHMRIEDEYGRLKRCDRAAKEEEPG